MSGVLIFGNAIGIFCQESSYIIPKHTMQPPNRTINSVAYWCFTRKNRRIFLEKLQTGPKQRRPTEPIMIICIIILKFVFIVPLLLYLDFSHHSFLRNLWAKTTLTTTVATINPNKCNILSGNSIATISIRINPKPCTISIDIPPYLYDFPDLHISILQICPGIKWDYAENTPLVKIFLSYMHELIFPYRDKLIDVMRFYLPNLSRLQTITRKVPPETATRIESDSIFSNAKTIYRPVPIDNRLCSCIVFIPWFFMVLTYHGHNLRWTLESKIRMYTCMQHYKWFFFYEKW